MITSAGYDVSIYLTGEELNSEDDVATRVTSFPLHLTPQKAPALPAMPTQLSAATRDYRALYVPIRRSGEGSKSTKYAQLHRMSYGTGCQWRDYLEWRYAVQAVASAGEN